MKKSPSFCESCGADREINRPQFKTARVRIVALRERDGVKCQLCYLPVWLSAPRHHPCAPSVDHIVPRASGGCNCMRNLRLTHYWCNHARGVRRVFDPRKHPNFEQKIVALLRECGVVTEAA